MAWVCDFLSVNQDRLGQWLGKPCCCCFRHSGRRRERRPSNHGGGRERDRPGGRPRDGARPRHLLRRGRRHQRSRRRRNGTQRARGRRPRQTGTTVSAAAGESRPAEAVWAFDRNELLFLLSELTAKTSTSCRRNYTVLGPPSFGWAAFMPLIYVAAFFCPIQSHFSKKSNSVEII